MHHAKEHNYVRFKLQKAILNLEKGETKKKHNSKLAKQWKHIRGCYVKNTTKSNILTLTNQIAKHG